MKNALTTCSLALNPNSPQPTAGMVKVQDGAMWAYGGTCCIRVPVTSAIGAAFNPKAALPFFRKERKAFSVTVNKGKLVFQDGKEKLSIKCLPPEEMVVLDTLGTPTPCTLDKAALKLALSVVDPAHPRLSAQGVQFRWGVAEGSDNKRLVSAMSGLPDDLEFNLPFDTAKVLLRMKSEVTGVTLEGHVVKFTFADSSSVASNLICESLVDMSHIFGGQEWHKLPVPDSLWKELLPIECSLVVIRDGKVLYLTEDDKGQVISEGELTQIREKALSLKIKKEYLDTLLSVCNDLRMCDNGNLLQAFGDNARCIVGLMTM